MSDYAVWSGSATPTAPYNTWATAAHDLGTIAALDAAGDRVFVATDHTEAPSGVLNWAGTAANPTQIICCDRTSNGGNFPPTVVGTGGLAGTTGTTNANFTAVSGMRIYGMTIRGGDGTNTNQITLANGRVILDTCLLHLNSNVAASVMVLGAAGGSDRITLRNPTLKFNLAGQRLAAGAVLEIIGGSIDATSAAITGFIKNNATYRSVVATIRGFDFTNAASTLGVYMPNSCAAEVVLHDCKMPAGSSWSLATAALESGSRVSAYNCGNDTANYRLWIEDYAGTIKDETTVVKTGGATDGTTPIAWNVLGSANANYAASRLHTDWRVVWVDAPGASTLTWDYVADANVAEGQGSGTSNAFTNAEVFAEVAFLGSASTPIASYASGAPATLLTAANSGNTDPGGAVTWGGSLTTPKKGQAAVSFTTAMKGFVLTRLVLCAASKRIYADPDPVLS